MNRRLSIAVDGPASSGKGTLARRVAQVLDYAYVDTGAMFRSVALAANEAGVPLDAADAVGAIARSLDLRFSWTGGALRVGIGERDVSETIRSEVVGRGASDVAVHPPVRSALLDQQRAMAALGGVVMDGRDIGTVVLPDADLKIYLDASPEERADRRHKELLRRGLTATFEQVLGEIVARDAQDSGRATAPLRAADDAYLLDSTGRTPAEMVAEVVALARHLLDVGDASR